MAEKYGQALVSSSCVDLGKWRSDPEYASYLAELTAMSVDRMRQEPENIGQEQRRILQETQELAFRNYKGFIQTADCSKEIFSEFLSVNNHVGDTLEKLPGLANECEHFLSTAPDITQRRRNNVLTLQHHTQLLELLEIPQLMETLVRNGHYEEALDLDAYVARLARKHGDVPVITSVAADVRVCTQIMLTQLLQLLRADINLPACLRVIGHIRRLGVFKEREVRTQFLLARGSWMKSNMQATDASDAYTLVNKCIDVTRLALFDITSQYRAVFADHLESASAQGGEGNSELLYGWAVEMMVQFAALLATHLPRVTEGALLHSLLDQCMYLCQSLSRVGLDCRCLLVPLFEDAVVRLFSKTVTPATDTFIEQVTSNIRQASTPAAAAGGGRGQMAITEFMHVTLLANAYIDALNNLRHCAPLSVADRLCGQVQEQLLRASQVLADRYLDYVEPRGDDEPLLRERYLKMCEVWALDAIPFVAQCFSTVYPPLYTYAPGALALPAVNVKAAAAPLDGIYRERTLAGDTWLSVPPKTSIHDGQEQKTSAAPAPATQLPGMSAPDLPLQTHTAPVLDEVAQQPTPPHVGDAYTTTAQQQGSSLPHQPEPTPHLQSSEAHHASVAVPTPDSSQPPNSLLDSDSPAEPTPPSAVFATTHTADLTTPSSISHAATTTPEFSADTARILDETPELTSDSSMQNTQAH